MLKKGESCRIYMCDEASNVALDGRWRLQKSRDNKQAWDGQAMDGRAWDRWTKTLAIADCNKLKKKTKISTTPVTTCSRVIFRLVHMLLMH